MTIGLRRMLLAFGVGVVGVVALNGVEVSVVDPLVGGDGSTSGVVIRGSLTAPLAPGRSTPLDLDLVNSSGSDVVITDIAVVVSSVTAPAATGLLPCTVEDFFGVAGHGRLQLSAATSTSLSEARWDPTSWPRVGMQDSIRNQDGCKGASLVLEYSAEGYG
jgi:hypothetical protein